MRTSRKARRRLLASMGVGSIEELRRLGVPLTLKNLWYDLGWTRMLVESLRTDPELPGQVSARIRRPGGGWGAGCCAWWRGW